MFELPPAPRLTGAVLRSVVAATSAEPVRRAVVALMRRELGMEAALALPASQRDALPLSVRPVAARPHHERPSEDLPIPEPSPILPSAAVFQARYRDGLAAPDAVCERALAEARWLGSATPAMTCLCALAAEGAMRDARASAERWARGEPLGPLDGVPVPIKEEVDIEGIGYRLGTSFIPRSEASSDATAVGRLRAVGAIILGHTPMTEMGMSPLGGNVHREMPRNAHAADRLPGGSSSGSAISVAVGLAPVALGSDGGGSIRHPVLLQRRLRAQAHLRPRVAPRRRLRRHGGSPGADRRVGLRPRRLPRDGQRARPGGRAHAHDAGRRAGRAGGGAAPRRARAAHRRARG
ncbi:MAG: amidase family protein [Sandaracinaceae bacterium]|nr:amidase family protein [Sandaracinaceae bacterium]